MTKVKLFAQSHTASKRQSGINNIRQNIFWNKSYQYFLRSVTQGNRNKNKQIGLDQAYILLHSKGNHKQNEKINLYNEKKYLAKNATNKGLISKIYKQFI